MIDDEIVDSYLNDSPEQKEAFIEYLDFISQHKDNRKLRILDIGSSDREINKLIYKNFPNSEII